MDHYIDDLVTAVLVVLIVFSTATAVIVVRAFRKDFHGWGGYE